MASTCACRVAGCWIPATSTSTSTWSCRISAFDPSGQLFFDIFTTDGFLGDLPLVNFAYAPVFEVLPRKDRFRILNACMSRFLQLQLADSTRQRGAVPVHRQ